MRWLLGLLAAALLLSARPARAAGACDPEASAWIARCGERHGLRLEPRACASRVVVVRAPDADLDVEIAADGGRSFRREGLLGLSPVGQFPDWGKETETRRRALDALAACAREDPTLPFVSPGVSPEVGSLRPVRPPWILAAAFALLAAVLWRRGCHRSRELGVALALGGGAWVLRAWLMPQAFFHQNGQGPAWVSQALRDDVGMASYGPGYAELFGAAARLVAARPERGLWLAQSLLGAALVAAVWVLARRLGAKPAVALALTLIVGLDPVLGRLAQSESYYAAGIALVGLAMLAISFADREPRGLWFWGAVVSAGLFCAQVVRLHPSCWPAVTLTPLPLLLGPGSFERRWRLSALATAGVVIVILVVAGPALGQVLGGALGRQWLPRVGIRWSALTELPLLSAMALVAAVGVALRSWRGVAAASFGVAVLALARVTDLLSDPNPAVTGAHQRTFSIAAVVVVATLAARWARSESRARWLAAAGLGLTLLHLSRSAAELRLPTDALEAGLALQWRRELEPGATVAALERCGSRLAMLPLYASVTAERAPLRCEEPSFDLGKLPQPAYYYRSSLCSTREGRPPCEALEHGARLELVTQHELPARASMRWHGYDGDVVRVALFRVRP